MDQEGPVLPVGPRGGGGLERSAKGSGYRCRELQTTSASLLVAGEELSVGKEEGIGKGENIRLRLGMVTVGSLSFPYFILI